MYEGQIITTTRSVITELLQTSPCQPRRSLGLPGGSAAKVFELRSQKTKIKTAKRGEFFDARLADSEFGNSGMVGSPFFGYVSLARQRK
jgi:hypothetical protein